MPQDRPSSPQSAANLIRTEAAALFGLAARTTAEIDGGARLHCLAAHQGLTDAVATYGLRAMVSPPARADARDAVTFVRDALRLLGSLPLEQFAARDVRDAAEHGRRALRLLP